MKNNRILALSGNDIFSGGGLSADLATYTLNGLHGFVAVTCLTALTEKGFEVFYQLSVWLKRHWTLSSNAQECLWYWILSWSARKRTMWLLVSSAKN